MKWQNEFGAKFPKKERGWTFFYFVISESFDGDVLYAHNKSLLILLIIIFDFGDSFKFTNTNKITQISSFVVLWEGGATKNSSTIAAMTMDPACYCCGYFSCNSPFWLLWLHWWVSPQETMLTCLIVVRGRLVAV